MHNTHIEVSISARTAWANTRQKHLPTLLADDGFEIIQSRVHYFIDVITNRLRNRCD